MKKMYLYSFSKWSQMNEFRDLHYNTVPVDSNTELCILKCGNDFLADQWLRQHASNAGVESSVPSQGRKILQVTWHSPPKMN